MTFNPTLKNALFFFAFGFFFGLFISFLWAQMLIPEYKPSAHIQTPKELVKDVAKTETVFAKKADTLNTQSQKLQTDLSITKAALKKANEKTADLRNQVFKLLDERFEITHQEESDTVCDSLASVVPILIASSEEKDSLNRSALINLESQVQNRDSVIALQWQQYSELKSAFTKSIDAQSLLDAENKALTKSIKRQRTKNKVVSTVLFVLSGAAATYLIRH